MLNQLFDFYFFGLFFPTNQNLCFTMENLMISINKNLLEINSVLLSNIPNIRNSFVYYTKNGMHTSYQMIITSNCGNTLIIENINTMGYFGKFCTNSMFRTTLRETFLELTGECEGCFLEENSVTVKIDFANFLKYMNQNMRMHLYNGNTNNIDVYDSHVLFVNMRGILFEAVDCINKIFSYIDLPNLCKTKLVCTKFAYVIKGCTLPPYIIDTMNDIHIEFSYGCFRDVQNVCVVDRYSEYIKKLHRDIKTSSVLMKYVNEYILLKCLMKFGSAVPNRLVEHMHNIYISEIEKADLPQILDGESKSNSLKLKLSLTREKFFKENFDDLSIFVYHLKNKKIHDLYSLINIKCVRWYDSITNRIGHYIIVKYGYKTFLELYMKNGWRCFPSLQYKIYPCYSEMVEYLRAMISKNVPIPCSVKKYFLDIIDIDDIKNCSKTTIKELADEAILQDNTDIFSKIFETKRIKKSKKVYIKYSKELKINCPKIIKYLKNSK